MEAAKLELLGLGNRKNGLREKEVDLDEEGIKFAERLKAGSGLGLGKRSENKQEGRNEKGNDD